MIQRQRNAERGRERQKEKDRKTYRKTDIGWEKQREVERWIKTNRERDIKN